MKSFFALLLVGLVAQQNAAEAFRVLAFYHGTWDEGHISFTRDCARFFPSVASANGFTYEATTDWNRISDNGLRDYDVVMFLDDLPSVASQRQAFQRYMENGGGFIGYHVSAFTTNANGWSWYHNTLLGTGNFVGNTWRPTTAVLANEVPSHPVLSRLASKFTVQQNEWYKWSNDLRNNGNIQILLSIHPDSFPLGTNQGETWYSGYYPVVWTHRNFNMLYINMGHNDIDYSNGNRELSHTFDAPHGENNQKIVIDGLKWLASKRRAAESPLFKAFNKA